MSATGARAANIAPPGAGKTAPYPVHFSTRAHRRLDRRPQPRAGTHVAAAHRGRARQLGGEVGYRSGSIAAWARAPGSVRTEGVLTRRLLGDPELRGVGCVIIDEFHERHLDGDLALALVARLRGRRPTLRLMVMSATLDAEPVRRSWRRRSSLGAAFPVPSSSRRT
jgi:ATP-dependent helicase HrpB